MCINIISLLHRSLARLAMCPIIEPHVFPVFALNRFFVIIKTSGSVLAREEETRAQFLYNKINLLMDISMRCGVWMANSSELMKVHIFYIHLNAQLQLSCFPNSQHTTDINRYTYMCSEESERQGSKVQINISILELCCMLSHRELNSNCVTLGDFFKCLRISFPLAAAVCVWIYFPSLKCILARSLNAPGEIFLIDFREGSLTRVVHISRSYLWLLASGTLHSPAASKNINFRGERKIRVETETYVAYFHHFHPSPESELIVFCVMFRGESFLAIFNRQPSLPPLSLKWIFITTDMFCVHIDESEKFFFIILKICQFIVWKIWYGFDAFALKICRKLSSRCQSNSFVDTLNFFFYYFLSSFFPFFN